MWYLDFNNTIGYYTKNLIITRSSKDPMLVAAFTNPFIRQFLIDPLFLDASVSFDA